MEYIWKTDRLYPFQNTGSYNPKVLPYQMRREIVVQYLFDDLIRSSPRFFIPCEKSKNKNFIYTVCFGLVPRWFDSTNDKEKMIFKEEQEITEILFVQRGTVGIGFSRLTFEDTEPFKLVY